MQAPIHFPFLTPFGSSREKVLHSPDDQLNSLAGSFSYVAPKFIKKYRPQKTHRRLVSSMLASIRIHKRNTGSLHSHHRLRSPLRPPSLFVSIILPPPPSKTPIPKLNFRVLTGTRFLIKSNALSDVSIHSIVPLLRRIYATLFLPPTRHAISRRSLPHSQKN